MRKQRRELDDGRIEREIIKEERENSVILFFLLNIACSQADRQADQCPRPHFFLLLFFSLFSSVCLSFVTHLHCSFLFLFLSVSLNLTSSCWCRTVPVHTFLYCSTLNLLFAGEREREREYSLSPVSLQCSIKQCNGLQSSGHSVLKRATNRQLSASLLFAKLKPKNQKTEKSKAFTTTTTRSVNHSPQLNCTALETSQQTLNHWPNFREKIKIKHWVFILLNFVLRWTVYTLRQCVDILFTRLLVCHLFLPFWIVFRRRTRYSTAFASRPIDWSVCSAAAEASQHSSKRGSKIKYSKLPSTICHLSQKERERE